MVGPQPAPPPERALSAGALGLAWRPPGASTASDGVTPRGSRRVAAKLDAGERDADLAEHLDRHEEPGEQEEHPEELAELEELGRAEPVERVGDRRDERRRWR